jgi:hypothetical protein
LDGMMMGFLFFFFSRLASLFKVIGQKECLGRVFGVKYNTCRLLESEQGRFQY